MYLDTEAVIARNGAHQVQTWRLAVTAHDHRIKGYERWRDPEWAVHHTQGELWDWIDARAKPGERMVVIAHNLAYDLRIADCFAHMLQRGWTLDRIRLDAQQGQVRWRHGKRTVLMIDSMAWFPVALKVIGDELGIDKPPLPEVEGAVDEWVERCMVDVTILRTAWRQVIDWLQREDLGVWQSTGAGQAWSTWRHRHMTDRVLVGDDQDVREMERLAVWCGRSEAWKHGVIDGGPFTEWDVELAYLRIMRDCGVPVRAVGRRVNPKPRDLAKWLDKACVLARVRITTTDPIVPTRSDHGIYWPVGTFETVVWDPELHLLFDSDAHVEVLEVVVYHRRAALSSFAEWLWPMASGDDETEGPVVRRVAKHWSRAFVGRFGVRYTQWEPFGATVAPNVGLETVSDLTTGETYRLLSAGDRCMRECGVVEGENAVPSIMGWIMSETRRRLWVTMNDAGLENVLHVDTDGLVVNAEGSRRLTEIGRAGIRIKATYETAEVIAARQVIYGGALRAPGVPRRAKRIDTHTWEGEAWERLTAALRAGEADRVRVSRRTMHLSGVDHRRAHSDGGTTEAFVLTEG